MAKVANLVSQKTRVVGTGNAELIARLGKRSFSSAFPTNSASNLFRYFLSHERLDEWEVGLGYLSGTALVRAFVEESSNGNALVNFSEGLKVVTNDVSAKYQEPLESLDIYSSEGSYPNRSMTFDEVVADMAMNKLYDYKFGTAAAGAGQTRIGNLTELAADFNPLQDGTGSFVINNELQRYPLNFGDYPQTLEFESDGLNLTASFEGGIPAAPTASPTAAVNYSRQVTIPDASNVKIGQVVGFGAEGYDLAHALSTMSVAGAVSGDVLTLVIAHVKTAAQGGFDPVTITSFTSAGGDDTALANDMVSKINANATLQTWKITAYKMPNVAGGFAFSAPRNPLTKNDNLGLDAKGSFRWFTRTFSRTGSATVLNPQQTFGACYVVSKSGNTLTLSNPVTLSLASVLTFNPTRMLEVAVTGGSTTYTFQDVSGISNNQVAQCSYQDNNIRRITNIDYGTNTITLEASVFMQAGHFLTIYPISRAPVTVSSSGNVLTFAATPPAVQVGQQVYNYFATNNQGIIKVVSFDATTVTLSANITVSNGDTIIFHPSIVSGQFWSKWIMMPATDNYEVIAMELTAKAPDASKIAAWPAWWLFTANNDPNPVLPVIAGNSEIDMLDTFTYWNNASSNSIVMNPVSGFLSLYQDAAAVSANGTVLNGNNLGSVERKIGLVWTRNKVYFYVDGILVFAKQATWNRHKRAQMGINQAVGSTRTSLNSNGFFPIDQSAYPSKYKVKNLKIYATPSNSLPPRL